MLTRRSFLGLGTVACGVAAGLLAGCAGNEAPFARYVGMEPQEAWEALVADGWVPQFQRVLADGNKGTVASVELASASASDLLDAHGVYHEELKDVGSDRIVTVCLAGMCQVPKLLLYGNYRSGALEALKDAGIDNVVVFDEDADEPSGARRASASDPLPGAWILPDDEVELTVSAYTTVPDIAGMKAPDAEGWLYSWCLEADAPYDRETYNETTAPTVVSTVPAAGEVVRVGSVVQVTYSA